ncbi:hypothetical protein [Actinosynnema sp. NPDC023587]|uniref:hypothetical protein n=1 Tax=Actinosynnema sp. NPDC023587 TaxID=3154695 RepID=UPI0033D9339E
MNTTPPPARDLPPGRHAEIRAELDRATTGPSSVRAAPLVAAASVATLVVGLSLLVPWRVHDPGGPAGSTPAAGLSDLPPQRVEAIEEGCARSAGIPPTAKLHQYVEDAGGKYAVLYTADQVLGCTVDGPRLPYDSGRRGVPALDWLPGPFSVDHLAGASGGDVPDAEDGDRGRSGWRAVTGRVGSNVVRVTFGYAGRTVDATLRDGTYLARIVFPPQWELPHDGSRGEVRGYDAAGRELGTGADVERQCYTRPDGEVVYGGQVPPDRSRCVPAVPWP